MCASSEQQTPSPTEAVSGRSTKLIHATNDVICCCSADGSKKRQPPPACCSAAAGLRAAGGFATACEGTAAELTLFRGWLPFFTPAPPSTRLASRGTSADRFCIGLRNSNETADGAARSPGGQNKTKNRTLSPPMAVPDETRPWPF